MGATSNTVGVAPSNPSGMHNSSPCAQMMDMYLKDLMFVMQDFSIVLNQLFSISLFLPFGIGKYFILVF